MSNAIEKGLSRLAYQFSDSLKFKGFITAFLQEFEELRLSGLQLLNNRYLDTAEGVQLDGIGEIVGLERPEEGVDVIGAFGFEDDDTAKGFGDISDPDIGGNFISIDSSSQLVGDDLYRLLIRAKIIKNQTAMTVDDTTRLISFTFGGVKVRYILVDNLHPKYEIGKFLDATEENLIQTFPILIGLGDVTYVDHNEDDVFSFAEDSHGLGFGDINDPTIGGNFAKLV